VQITTSDGIQIHVHEKPGSGPPTMLLHGWAVPGAVWRTIVDRWPADAGPLYVLDQRGTGWSSKPESGYTLDNYAADVAAVIDQLGLKELKLVGHSMGGTIALLVALLRPGALRKVCLVNPVPPSGVPLDEQQVAYFRSLGGHRPGAEQVISMTTVRPVDRAVLDELLRDAASVSSACFHGAFDAWRGASVVDRVKELRVPVDVISGVDARILPPAFLQATVVDVVPGARWVGIPGGHYPQLESPDELLAALLEG
jgi:non-heme chloroperoxidase